MYLLRTPRLIVLALAVASDRNAGTGLGGLGTARWIIGGCFYSMRPASGESVTTRSMRALLALQSRQVVSKKQLALLSVELCVKAVGQGDSSPFVPLSYSLDSQIDFTLQQGCSTGRHRTPPERSCMCLLMTCWRLQLSRSGILLQNIRCHGSTSTQCSAEIDFQLLIFKAMC